MSRKSSSSVQLEKPCSGAIACAVSPASVTERCALRRVQQHRQLQRREVLHLVDHQVLVGEHALARPCGAGGRAGAGRCAAAARRPRRRTRTSRRRSSPRPPVRSRSRATHQRWMSSSWPGEKQPGRVAGEPGAQRLAIGEQRRPLADHVARARAQRAADVLQRVARRGIEVAVAHPLRQRGDARVGGPAGAVPEREHGGGVGLARQLGLHAARGTRPPAPPGDRR